VASRDELTGVFDLLGAQATPVTTLEHRGFADLARRFDDDRSLILVAEAGCLSAGAALACRKDSGVKPPCAGRRARRAARRAADAPPAVPGGRGPAAGREEIFEGGAGDDLAHYERLGSRGRSPMIKHLLPLPGRAREARLGAPLAAAPAPLGDAIGPLGGAAVDRRGAERQARPQPSAADKERRREHEA
jgi:hypothetical protein